MKFEEEFPFRRRRIEVSQFHQETEKKSVESC